MNNDTLQNDAVVYSTCLPTDLQFRGVNPPRETWTHISHAAVVGFTEKKKEEFARAELRYARRFTLYSRGPWELSHNVGGSDADSASAWHNNKETRASPSYG